MFNDGDDVDDDGNVDEKEKGYCCVSRKRG